MASSDFNITETGEWNDATTQNEISKSLVDWLVGRRFATNSENSQRFGEERIFTGFLEKQGGWRKNWRRRLFSLFKDSLAYYDDATANEKMLGEVQLCARGPDGQVVAALVWDYARAIQEGHNIASPAVLDQYAPPKERRGTNYVEHIGPAHTPARKFRGRALASRTTQVFENLGDKILGSLGKNIILICLGKFIFFRTLQSRRCTSTPFPTPATTPTPAKLLLLPQKEENSRN